MIPAGYLYKRVVARPDWLSEAAHVHDIFSISGCVSKEFLDYISFWRHNGAWLFDEPGVMREIAQQAGIDIAGLTLFYYDVHEFQFVEASRSWEPIRFEDSFPMRVVAPSQKALHGYDVASFSVNTSPECSPLSCNALCETLPVNAHCLFDTFEAAKTALEDGAFDTAEPGPYRIFAVHTV